MAEELQSLLERIHEKGIKKAEDEKNRIIAEAKAEAKKIIDSAKDKAETLRKKAEEEAALTKSRAEEAIRQAARDITISLKTELLERLKNTVKTCIGEAMTPELMKQILLEMAKNYIRKNPGSEAGLEVMLFNTDPENMEKLFKGSLVEGLKLNPEFSLGHDSGAGLKIGFKGDNIFFDFSDDAISDLICSYIGPKLAAVINGEKK